MLAQQRQQAILELVQQRGGVRVADLVREFCVSDMTIRRDLETLADRGLVTKVHGGATALGTASTEEPGFTAKSDRQRAEKEIIARRAAELVRPGTAIALSAGTTTWTLAHHLTEMPELTVVTNSVRIAEVFYRAGRRDQTIVLTGGVRTPSDALVGPVAVAAVRSLNVDLLLLGVHGMSTRAGFTTPNLMEAETDRAMVGAARRLVVLADHTKWGTVGLSTIARLADADVLVTDSGIGPEARKTLAEEAGELMVVDAGAPSTAGPAGKTGKLGESRESRESRDGRDGRDGREAAARRGAGPAGSPDPGGIGRTGGDPGASDDAGGRSRAADGAADGAADRAGAGA